MSEPRTLNVTLPLPDTRAADAARVYDAAIIGGGLGGLTLSIILARAGFSVILFEKERYPFHRVCGEYISLESWNFLESLGLPLQSLNLPIIKKLEVTAPDGTMIRHELPLGGFGISRFRIDEELARVAVNNGVQLMEDCKVTDVRYARNQFAIENQGRNYHAKVVCGAFGKRSNLDIRWKRPFTQRKPNRLNNYIGVKYHIRINRPADTISLHNFSNGYCGISRVEGDKYCLCYLTTAANLNKSGHLVANMEKNILRKNPFLKAIFEQAEVLYQSPLTISQISFEQKSLIEQHMLMIGDASGMITPLCGNGMSMAIHGAKLAGETIALFLAGKLTRQQLEDEYVHKWNTTFRKRLMAGRIIQKFFGKELITNIFIRLIKPFPGIVSYLIRQTHGQPF